MQYDLERNNTRPNKPSELHFSGTPKGGRQERRFAQILAEIKANNNDHLGEARAIAGKRGWDLDQSIAAGKIIPAQASASGSV